MAVVVPITLGSDLITAHPSAKVEARLNWTDPWVLLPDARVISLSRTVGTGIDRANILFHYGDIDNVIVPPATLIGRWVKITIAPSIGDKNFDQSVQDITERLALEDLEIGWRVLQLDSGAVYQFIGPDESEATSWLLLGIEDWFHQIIWYGVVTDETRDHRGNNATNPTGDQVFTAHGVEWLLTRKQVVQSVVEKLAGAETKTVGRAINFNDFVADHVTGTIQERGNRTNVPGPDGLHLFAKSLANPSKWRGRDIVAYLLKYFSPTIPQITWLLDPNTAGLLNWSVPSVVAHGRSVYDVINEVIDRRRGFTWAIDVNEINSTFTLRVISFAEIDIALPSGEVIAENPDQVALSVLDESHLDGAVLTTSYQTRYQQVVAIGGRRGACFTVTPGTIIWPSTLVDDWDSALRTAYITAASGDEDYPEKLSDQKAANDSERQGDRLRRVFTSFRLRDEWDGKIFDQGVALEPACPDLLDEHRSVEFWQPGLRFESYLPLITGFDYSDGPENATDENPEDSVPELLRPFAVINLPDGRWEYVDKLSSHSRAEGKDFGAGIEFNCHVRMMDHQAGVVVEPTAPPHVIALDVYDPSSAAPSEYKPLLDGRSMLITVFALFDEHVQVSYPVPPEPSIWNSEQALYIRLGDDYRLDWMPRRTVIGLSNGKLKQSENAGWLRDDRQQLADVARTAWQWYATPRRAIQVGFRAISNQLRVGQMIRTFASGATQEPVNAVITGIGYDMIGGRQTLFTDFGELDFTRAGRAPGPRTTRRT